MIFVWILAQSGSCSNAKHDDVLGHVADMPVHASVVAQVADEEDLSEARALARVLDVLRLAARMRDDKTGSGDEKSLLDARRVHQLRRAGSARLWLSTNFAPQHRPEHVPEHVLERAKQDVRYLHPELHLLCQVVAIPIDGTVPEAGGTFWPHARQAIDRLANWFDAAVSNDDARVCEILTRISILAQPDISRGIKIKFEDGAFELDACAQRRDDGTCEQPRWDPDFVAAVRAGRAGDTLPAFHTRFGVHLVFLREVLPAQTADDPQLDERLRVVLHPGWQREAFHHAMQALREKHSIRLVTLDPSP